MKKFLRKISFFIALIFIGWLSLELFYRYVPNNYSQKNIDVTQNYDSAQLLILGNSHAFYGLNPAFFDVKAYNLSNKSQTLMFDKLLFDKHVDQFNDLKYVVLNVEYSSLSQDDDRPEMQWRKYFYETQMGIEAGVSNFDIKKYSLALAPRLSITLSSLGKYMKTGTIVECMSNGWSGKIGVNEKHNNPEMGKIIVQKHEDGSTNFIKNKKRIKSVIEKCRLKEIKVILVTMPVTSYYADNVNTKKMQLIFNECQTLAGEYKNVSYINLFQDNRFENNNFYDTDHLNIQGAKKCSIIINALINK